MHLYSTTLKIKNRLVPYTVSREDGGKFLLFKPQPPITSFADVPIFWVTKQNGEWMPVNIKDKTLVTQILNDIYVHEIE